MLALMGLDEAQMKLLLTRYLSDHSLRDPPVGQEGLNLLFDHSAVPPTSREENLLFTTKCNKGLHFLQQSDVTNTYGTGEPAVTLQSTYIFMAVAIEAEYVQESEARSCYNIRCSLSGLISSSHTLKSIPL